MGKIYHGIPKDLTLFLKERASIEDFYETGTLAGESAAWAAEKFGRVVTIEAAEHIVAESAPRLKKYGNVRSIHADSAPFLTAELLDLDRNAIFWLDAHWMGPGSNTAGDNNECPVLAEIEAINGSGRDHIILVDDAQLFCAPPPHPHNLHRWPSLGTIVHSLSRGGRRVFLFEDVLIAVSGRVAEALETYLQERTTKAWLHP